MKNIHEFVSYRITSAVVNGQTHLQWTIPHDTCTCICLTFTRGSREDRLYHATTNSSGSTKLVSSLQLTEIPFPLWLGLLSRSSFSSSCLHLALLTALLDVLISLILVQHFHKFRILTLCLQHCRLQLALAYPPLVCKLLRQMVPPSIAYRYYI